MASWSPTSRALCLLLVVHTCLGARTPWRSRLGATNVVADAARATGVRPPWNAPKVVWKMAWKLQARCLPLLHAADRLDLGASLADTNVNLHCLWWKAIQGDAVAYAMLPSYSRLLVSRPMRLFYPLLHHQNVAIRTAYLDAALGRAMALARADNVQLVVLVLGGGFDTRALRFGGVSGVEFVETDLPAVIAAKRTLISRRLSRRLPAMRAKPTLDALDMNNATDRERFVSTTLRSALERARRTADAAARRADGSGAHPVSQPSGSVGVRTLVLAEATLLYVQPGSADATICACFGECRREALEASARGSPSAHAATQPGHTYAQLLFADRLPGTVPNTRGEAAGRNLDTAEARALEHAAVERWLGETASLRLREYLVKPGMARQMGVASASLG